MATSFLHLTRPEGNKAAFTKLMYATVAMILLPVPTYFLAYYVARTFISFLLFLL
jgi:hypothetical protein